MAPRIGRVENRQAAFTSAKTLFNGYWRKPICACIGWNAIDSAPRDGTAGHTRRRSAGVRVDLKSSSDGCRESSRQCSAPQQLKKCAAIGTHSFLKPSDYERTVRVFWLVTFACISALQRSAVRRPRSRDVHRSQTVHPEPDPLSAGSQVL
jgi:hypothetical protein